MSYEILISEEQRALIAKMLTECHNDYVVFDDKEEHEKEELGLLAGMFSELKDDEDNYYTDRQTGKRKHMLHGFCL